MYEEEETKSDQPNFKSLSKINPNRKQKQLLEVDLSDSPDDADGNFALKTRDFIKKKLKSKQNLLSVGGQTLDDGQDANHFQQLHS